MRIRFLTFLFLFTPLALSATEISSKEIFRSQVEQYAKHFDGTLQSAVCVTWDPQNEMDIKNYQFKVVDNSAQFKDSFFVYFYREGKLDFSTLVAYVGHNSYPLGQLSVTEDDQFKTLEHTFNGYLTDKLRMETNKATTGLKLEFYKENHGVLLRSIKCSPTVGI